MSLGKFIILCVLVILFINIKVTFSVLTSNHLGRKSKWLIGIWLLPLFGAMMAQTALNRVVAVDKNNLSLRKR